MRSWVLSVWLIAPVRAKRTRPRVKLWCLWPRRQSDRQPPGGDMIDSAALAVSGGQTVADETLVEGQIR